MALQEANQRRRRAEFEVAKQSALALYMAEPRKSVIVDARGESIVVRDCRFVGSRKNGIVMTTRYGMSKPRSAPQAARPTLPEKNIARARAMWRNR